MIWFGSSAGVALANMYPEAKSVGLWLRHGRHVAVAHVIGFFFMLAIIGWRPDARCDASISLIVLDKTPDSKSDIASAVRACRIG
jgi:hypothetical protein